MPLSVPQLAVRYGCSERTVFRWKAREVDIQNVLAVADHIIAHPGQRIETVRAVSIALTEIPPVDGRKVWADAFKKGLQS